MGRCASNRYNILQHAKVHYHACNRVQVQPISGDLRASTHTTQAMFSVPNLTTSNSSSSTTSKYICADLLYGDYIPGGIRIQIPDPYKNVTRITLRECFVPRVDNLLYGVKFLPSKDQPDKIQIGQSPSQAQPQSNVCRGGNGYSMVKVTPHAPIFAQIGLAQAESTASLQLADNKTDIKYTHDFKPPLRTVETMEITLFKAPSANATYDLQPYDIIVYQVALSNDISYLDVRPGQSVTTQSGANLISSDHDFTAI